MAKDYRGEIPEGWVCQLPACGRQAVVYVDSVLRCHIHGIEENQRYRREHSPDDPQVELDRITEQVRGDIGLVFKGELTYRGAPLIALQEANAKIAAAREAIRKFGDETAPILLWAKPRDNVEPFLAELLQILQ